MDDPAARSRAKQWLNLFLAYLLFALFALLGVVLMFNIHTSIVSINMLYGARPQVTRFWYVWGAFFLLALYVPAMVALEQYMNRAAMTGRILNHGLRVFAIEGGLALLSEVIPWLLEALHGA